MARRHDRTLETASCGTLGGRRITLRGGVPLG
jgi:hypothetical protein